MLIDPFLLLNYVNSINVLMVYFDHIDFDIFFSTICMPIFYEMKFSINLNNLTCGLLELVYITEKTGSVPFFLI